MPLKTIAKFEVKYLQILNEHGKVDRKLLPKIPDKDMLKWYRDMVLARKFSDKMLALQRSGRMGTFAPVNGQEAAQVGSCAALSPKDWMFPAFREIAAYINRGGNEVPMLLYNMGSEFGNQGDEGFNNYMAAVPVGSQYLHAVGMAWASKIKKEKTVTICYGGDGATSQGDFYEAMNFAGVFQLPIILICQNNQWAISTPRKHQTNAETIAQKGIAAGIECLQVDGNDIFAVYRGTKEAVERARKGKGPTVLELVTYRLSMHTTADDPRVYRTEKEVEQWRKKDPIDRFRKYLEHKKIWNKKKEQQLIDDLDNHIAGKVKEAQAKFNKDPSEMFKHVFATMPDYIKEEMESVAGQAKEPEPQSEEEKAEVPQEQPVTKEAKEIVKETDKEIAKESAEKKAESKSEQAVQQEGETPVQQATANAGVTPSSDVDSNEKATKSKSNKPTKGAKK